MNFSKELKIKKKQIEILEPKRNKIKNSIN